MKIIVNNEFNDFEIQFCCKENGEFFKEPDF